MTEHHGYNTPSPGVTDWHRPLNDNFRQIDNDIEIRDIEGNRDQYTSKTARSSWRPTPDRCTSTNATVNSL